MASPGAQYDRIERCPLRVHVSIRFTDPVIRSRYRRTYESSAGLPALHRFCDGLVRRIEHCCEELITRRDSSALFRWKDGCFTPKPLRFEMSFRVVRERDGEFFGRSFRSYQKYPLTVETAKEVILTSHSIIGLFLRRHDSHFFWEDGESATCERPGILTPPLDGPPSEICVSRAHWGDSSPGWKPGYHVELILEGRLVDGTVTVSRRLDVMSRQSAPLALVACEDLLAAATQAVQQGLAHQLQQQSNGHATESLPSRTSQHANDLMHIDLRVHNTAGPSYDHLCRTFQSSFSLAPDPKCDNLLCDFEARLATERDSADAKITDTNDFELKIVEVKGWGWSAHEPAKFCLAPTDPYPRRIIDAAVVRVQTGIRDVLRGLNVAVRITVHTKGHVILDKTLAAHERPGTRKEVFGGAEQMKRAMVERLRERIEKDIEMVCKDTCELGEDELEREGDARGMEISSGGLPNSDMAARLDKMATVPPGTSTTPRRRSFPLAECSRGVGKGPRDLSRDCLDRGLQLAQTGSDMGLCSQISARPGLKRSIRSLPPIPSRSSLTSIESTGMGSSTPRVPDNTWASGQRRGSDVPSRACSSHEAERVMPTMEGFLLHCVRDLEESKDRSSTMQIVEPGSPAGTAACLLHNMEEKRLPSAKAVGVKEEHQESRPEGRIPAPPPQDGTAPGVMQRSQAEQASSPRVLAVDFDSERNGNSERGSTTCTRGLSTGGDSFPRNSVLLVTPTHLQLVCIPEIVHAEADSSSNDSGREAVDRLEGESESVKLSKPCLAPLPRRNEKEVQLGRSGAKDAGTDAVRSPTGARRAPVTPVTAGEKVDSRVIQVDPADRSGPDGNVLPPTSSASDSSSDLVGKICSATAARDLDTDITSRPSTRPDLSLSARSSFSSVVDSLSRGSVSTLQPSANSSTATIQQQQVILVRHVSFQFAEPAHRPSTAGYLGLHEERVVEFGLRGALTGSKNFTRPFGDVRPLSKRQRRRMVAGRCSTTSADDPERRSEHGGKDVHGLLAGWANRFLGRA